ncbi:methyltransferase domain-containing protein [Streptomyces sp. NBC_01142]|uniref:methyltransferase domain-containing protein n=1 Tax=Streptomyces sp. NBC_01142 TaxID=2975865 RepID=UPI002252EA76|nr:methyltransferase domain-containing protein [Streptomyces sp. NBC_01142]MCX4824263.1 methyltransferase domain-containing protein [Streptomyces sp. NBC_01142]
MSAALRQTFAAELDPQFDRGWVDAFAAVPRHVFVPRYYAQSDDRSWRSVTLGDPGYMETIYSNQALTTQLDEHGIPTSSSSEPALMLEMLDALDAHQGDTVFELGTGTGYNTALLSHRLGDDNVTSIDVDPSLVEAAAFRLEKAGYRPFVTTGDGARGWPQRSPYTRIIATAALRAVPAPFLDQAAPGAIIVAPIGYGVLRATITAPGHATGRFLPTPAHFMPRRTPGAAPAFDAVRSVEPTDTKVAPTDVLDRLRFPLSIALPGHSSCSWRDDDGELTAVGLWTEDGSTATAHVSGSVRQIGPRRLWDVVEDLAIFENVPHRDDFHMTITPSRQTVWYNAPDGPSWELPGGDGP